jgi:hypothetical protein
MSESLPLVPVSLGELFDKISILEIKLERISDPEKRGNISKERNILVEIVSERKHPVGLSELRKALRKVNEELWEIEDEIRLCEKNKDFGARFVELARSVYITNDLRSKVKRDINLLCGSSLIEEKSYKKYSD